MASPFFFGASFWYDAEHYAVGDFRVNSAKQTAKADFAFESPKGRRSAHEIEGESWLWTGRTGQIHLDQTDSETTSALAVSR